MTHIDHIRNNLGRLGVMVIGGALMGMVDPGVATAAGIGCYLAYWLTCRPTGISHTD